MLIVAIVLDRKISPDINFQKIKKLIKINVHKS
jgi:hypothetical protein